MLPAPPRLCNPVWPYHGHYTAGIRILLSDIPTRFDPSDTFSKLLFCQANGAQAFLRQDSWTGERGCGSQPFELRKLWGDRCLRAVIFVYQHQAKVMHFHLFDEIVKVGLSTNLLFFFCAKLSL
jgi:hypothetical protein